MLKKTENIQVDNMKCKNEWSLPDEITLIIAKKLDNPLHLVNFSLASTHLNIILSNEPSLWPKYSSSILTPPASGGATRRSQWVKQFNNLSNKLKNSLFSISDSGYPFPNIFLPSDILTLKHNIENIEKFFQAACSAAQTWSFDLAISQIEAAEHYSKNIGLTGLNKKFHYNKTMRVFVDSTLSAVRSVRHKEASLGLITIAYLAKISSFAIPIKFYSNIYSACVLDTSSWPTRKSRAKAIAQSFDTALNLFKLSNFPVPIEFLNVTIR